MWQKAESCSSDHCSFFSAGYPTFNFSAQEETFFWQEWHSPSDTFEFMTAKAGGPEYGIWFQQFDVDCSRFVCSSR